MKKTIVMLVVALLYFFSGFVSFPTAHATEENDEFYPEWMIPEDCIRINCPSIDDSWFTNDTDMLLLMNALREWYYTTSGKEEHFLNNECLLIINPYIFQVDNAQQEKTIYCTSYFDSYLLYSDREMNKTLCLLNSSFLAISVNFGEKDGQWKVENIYIPELDEELIPGWGIGTQGMNGVTDEMIVMMSKSHHYDRCEDYVQQYLIHTNMTDTIVDRE